MSTDEKKSKRGLQLLSPERRREIARKGGLAAQATGRAHRFTQETAGEAGRKGGLKVSADKLRMSEMGRKGGLKRGERMRARKLEVK